MTDVIIPARHLAITDPKGLAEHCMEDIDADFINKCSGRRHYRCQKEFRLRFIKRTCSDCY